MPNPIGTVFDRSSSAQELPYGSVGGPDGEGRRYLYVKFVGKIRGGSVCSLTGQATKTAGALEVNDSRTTRSARNKAIGVAFGTHASNRWGYLQIAGPNRAKVLTDGGIKAGNLVHRDQDTAGILETSLSASEGHASASIGFAMDSDSGSFMAVGDLLLLNKWGL